MLSRALWKKHDLDLKVVHRMQMKRANELGVPKKQTLF